eukprot:TRINITY_DN19426_c0_g1_i2.p1 TRINITY_DN19426_c0_g1~~TRINITY_DN19426_c0_g1_i2.p1  ORF type:complete len:800 (+),score=37.03 TRINITY_DN19426_c0_g1_i2:116-2515(+)
MATVPCAAAAGAAGSSHRWAAGALVSAVASQPVRAAAPSRLKQVVGLLTVKRRVAERLALSGAERRAVEREQVDAAMQDREAEERSYSESPAASTPPTPDTPEAAGETGDDQPSKPRVRGLWQVVQESLKPQPRSPTQFVRPAVSIRNESRLKGSAAAASSDKAPEDGSGEGAASPQSEGRQDCSIRREETTHRRRLERIGDDAENSLRQPPNRGWGRRSRGSASFSSSVEARRYPESEVEELNGSVVGGGLKQSVHLPCEDRQPPVACEPSSAQRPESGACSGHNADAAVDHPRDATHILELEWSCERSGSEKAGSSGSVSESGRRRRRRRKGDAKGRSERRFRSPRGSPRAKGCRNPAGSYLRGWDSVSGSARESPRQVGAARRDRRADARARVRGAAQHARVCSPKSRAAPSSLAARSTDREPRMRAIARMRMNFVDAAHWNERSGREVPEEHRGADAGGTRQPHQGHDGRLPELPTKWRSGWEALPTSSGLDSEAIRRVASELLGVDVPPRQLSLADQLRVLRKCREDMIDRDTLQPSQHISASTSVLDRLHGALSNFAQPQTEIELEMRQRRLLQEHVSSRVCAAAKPAGLAPRRPSDVPPPVRGRKHQRGQVSVVTGPASASLPVEATMHATSDTPVIQSPPPVPPQPRLRCRIATGRVGPMPPPAAPDGSVCSSSCRNAPAAASSVCRQRRTLRPLSEAEPGGAQEPCRVISLAATKAPPPSNTPAPSPSVHGRAALPALARRPLQRMHGTARNRKELLDCGRRLAAAAQFHAECYGDAFGSLDLDLVPGDA